MAFGEDTTRNYREFRLSELGGIGKGIDLSRHETLLAPNVSPNAKNIEFDRYSVASVGGGIKFNNQAAPRSCVEFRPDPSLTPLYFDEGLAVPLRGYGYIPYQREFDLGGDFVSEGDFRSLSETFHGRRGRAFQLDLSFQIPAEEKLYGTPTNGTQSSPGNASVWNPLHGFDQALDDCTILMQKGGDRTCPMSWAIGVVNIGNAAGLTSATTLRISNYALVFMWLDSPGWGFSSPELMYYNLTSGALPTAGSPCTQAYRAVLIHKYVEPGRSYHLALQLKLDTGTPGATATNTAWNDDGYFRAYVRDELGALTSYSAVDSGAGVTFSGMEVVRGPQDSAEYLCKYGVRWSGTDAMFLGLGARSFPWKETGFLPFGQDQTPLDNGGFLMVDRSDVTITDLYGAAVHTLTATHTLGDTYVEVNHQGLTQGNTNGGLSPYGIGNWAGLGDGSLAFNAEALRGYRLVTTEDFSFGTPGLMRGAILNILSYEEVGASYRVHVSNGAVLGTWTAEPVLVQCFRWNQRSTRIGAVRIWSAPRDLEASDATLKDRRRFSVGAYVDPNDASEPDRETLLAVWNLDDAEGTSFAESVLGGVRSGHFCPFGLGQTEGGGEGRMTFLSGEGEAISFDLSENPVFLREFDRMLADDRLGLAVEITAVFTEAFYAIKETVDLPDSDDGAGGHLSGARPRYVPDLISWESVKQDAPAETAPLLTLTHRGVFASTNTAPFLRPMGFGVEVAHRTDQEDDQVVQPQDLQPVYVDGTVATRTRYDPNAGWVGRRVTMQVGIQPTGGGSSGFGEYDVYLAMTPKSAFKPEDGDSSAAEFAYWTDGSETYTPSGYFDAAHINIAPKQVGRPVITIGRYNCAGLGYAEIQPRMLIEKIRVYAAPAPGRLPSVSGAVVTTRDGKLQGAEALPQRTLTREDMLLPLGPSGSSVDLTDDSTAVLPSGNATFFTGNAWETARALAGTYMLIPGDTEERRQAETVGEEQENFYLVDSVAAAGASLTTVTPYKGGTRDGAVAHQIRVVGYTAFADDIRDLPLSLGAGASFEPGVTTVEDVILSQDLWENVAPLTGAWRARIYSPLGVSTLRDVLPRWVRGLNRPSALVANPALGMYGFNERVLMAVKGAVFEMDDRWRPDGPTDELRTSLAFRARRVGREALLPVAFDHVEYASAATAAMTGISDTLAYFWDAWVKLDELGGTRCYVHLALITSNPAANAGAGGHRPHIALRVTNGTPELVLGSTAQYGTPSALPERGLWVAQGLSTIPAGKWVHLRWTLTTRAGATILEKPSLFVQGRAVSSRVLAVDNNAAITQPDDWMRVSTVVGFSGTTSVLLGCARDAVLEPSRRASFVKGAVSGRILEPEIRSGYVHSLGGQLCGVFGGLVPVARIVPFDPLAIDYQGVMPKFTALFGDITFGHVLFDEPGDQRGIVRSHPAVSAYHELGSSTGRASFAEFGQQVYVTTGGRVGRVGPEDAGPAGLLEPVTALSCDVVRLPLWKPNVRIKGMGNQPENDPVDGAAAGAADQVNHFDNHGNNYLTALAADFTGTGATEIGFTKASTVFCYFGFKGYFRLRRTAGRVQLFGHRTGFEKGGQFVEVVDGKVRAGWYDLYLKRDVYVETSRAIVEPGYWYYIYYRKRWPQADPIEGNWQDQFWSNALIRRITVTAPVGTFLVGEEVTWGAAGVADRGFIIKSYGAAATTVEVTKKSAVSSEPSGTITGLTSGATATFSVNRHPMNDMLVVRRFRKFTGTVEPQESYDVRSLNPQRVSMTTSVLPSPAGTQGRGQVTFHGLTCTGAAGGQVDADFGEPFIDTHIGSYFEWGTAAGEPFAGRAYRIASVSSPTRIFVVDARTGAVPDFSSIAGVEGAAFMGVSLVKSEGFDQSTMPDDAEYPLEFFGGSEGIEALSGVARFDGEFDCFGITCIRDDDGQDARVFENKSTLVGSGNDSANVGLDSFGAFIGNQTGQPGALHFDTWVTGAPGVNLGTWLSVHGQTYAGAGAGDSTQPNADLEVAKDTGSSADAPDLTWMFLEAQQAFAAERYIRARFRDADQGVRSNPGPALLLLPGTEDEANPSGQVRYRLRDLPAPRQAGNIEVELYMSAAGGSEGSGFLVASVPAGTREVVIDPVASTLTAGVSIDFASFAPPRCSIVQAARSRMFYGALESQPDEVRFSRPGLPVSIDLGDGVTPIGRFRLTSGYGDAITMLHELDGLLVVAKRRALASVVVSDSGVPFVDLTSSGVGCVSHQSALSVDSALVFVSDRGLQLVQRSGVTNLGRPEWIGEPVEPYFRGQVDRRFLFAMAAALNRARNQYVLLTKLTGFKRQSGRLTLEITPENQIRYGLHEGPNLTAICSVQARDGGIEQLVGGTEEGYAVWLDRADTPHPLMSLVQETSGYTKVFTSGVGTRYGAAIQDPDIKLDPALDGPRGVTLSYPVLVGDEVFVRQVTALAATSTGLLFAELVSAQELTQDGQPMLVGAARRLWETPWMSFGVPEKAKLLDWVDFVFRDQVSGTLQVSFYLDFDRERAYSPTVLDLSEREHPVGLSLQATWFKLVLEDVPLEVAPAFELTDIIFRVTPAGQE